MNSRKIYVGADPFPPYQYVNQAGLVEGIDYDQVKELFSKAGFQIEVILEEWNILESMLKKGSLDALFQVQKSTEREKQYYFSDLLRNAVTEVITSNPKLELTNYQQIAQYGLTLGGIKGYAYGPEMDAVPSICKRTYNTSEELLLAVSEGEIDMGIFDRGLKEYLLMKCEISNIYSIGKLQFVRPLYVMFREKGLRDMIIAKQGNQPEK